MGLRKCAFRIGIAFDMPRQRQENQVCETPGRNGGGQGALQQNNTIGGHPRFCCVLPFPLIWSLRRNHTRKQPSLTFTDCLGGNIMGSIEHFASKREHLLSSRLSCQHASCTAMEFRQVFRFSLRRASSSPSYQVPMENRERALSRAPMACYYPRCGYQTVALYWFAPPDKKRSRVFRF